MQPVPSGANAPLSYAVTNPEACGETVTAYQASVRQQLQLIGEDPNREGLAKTPERVAKSMAWLTRGYGLTARGVVGDALFDEAHENMEIGRAHV